MRWYARITIIFDTFETNNYTFGDIYKAFQIFCENIGKTNDKNELINDLEKRLKRQ